MNQKAYNILKAIALIWLPALGTLVFALSDIWHLDNGSQIVGTIVAIDTFLGAGLGISARGYNNKPVDFDGALVVNTADPAKDTFRLEFEKDPYHMADKQAAVLKVVTEDHVAAQTDPGL
jgi:Putative phage holin Dp-1